MKIEYEIKVQELNNETLKLQLAMYDILINCSTPSAHLEGRLLSIKNVARKALKLKENEKD